MPKTLRVVCDAGEAIRYILIFNNLLFIHVFLASLGLFCCARLFLAAGSGGYGAWASLIAEHGLYVHGLQ